ncbi:helix-turn-helix domain-containing protein [Mesobacillus subterraneus]|uniref:Helix-turn-helix domain-containing protein n=1 Tax=Mesobacillus subterraneus TaxID=285983 RepID=A0A3R9EZU6_9BACI|nr:helix-turn-helix domain-containing protein [Mesobacillus subterraneus]RSD26909.1 helix-turn-helix domain-containing protein [Mesobacillus subterraneus]
MVGEKIKNLRLKKRYSITELSEKANVSKSYLSYIERGIQENPSLQVLTRLAKTLDTTVEFLMGNEISGSNGGQVDAEWLLLVDEAIKSGISKEDFAYYLDFMKFKTQRKEGQ